MLKPPFLTVQTSQGGGGGAFATASRMDAAKLATGLRCNVELGQKQPKLVVFVEQNDLKQWDMCLEKLENHLKSMKIVGI